MKNIFIILFLVLLFASCSQKGKTKSSMIVSIGSIAASNLEAYRDGGAMLYGKNTTTGDKFAINLIDVAGPLELELTNGDWSFSGFLWDGGVGQDRFRGISYCTSLNKNLSGGDIELPLNFTNETCEQFADNMSGSAGSKEFPVLEIIGCRNLSTISSDSDTCNETLGNEGIPQSYKVIVKTFNSNTSFPVGNALEECFAASASKDVFTGLTLPQARVGLPMNIEIKSYYDTGCTNIRGHHSKIFENGFSITNIANKKVFATASNTTKLYHDVTGQDVCNTSTADRLSAFSSGEGSAASPFGICFPEQWDIIGESPAMLSDHYELLKNIDFSGRMTDVAGAVNPPLPDTCVGYGGNFRPVGDPIATFGSAPCDTAHDGATTFFSGNFDGNNNKILNPYLFHGGVTRAGLFRYTKDATIENLIIENAEIEGEDKTGIIVGEAESTYFKNIKIINSMVFGEESTGSLAGVYSGYTPRNITDIFVTKGSVEARGDYIGGVIGLVSNTTNTNFSKLYFAGSVEARDSSGGPSSGVGGIIGKIGSGPTHVIDNVVSRGIVFGRMTDAGGIIGADYSSSLNFTKFRSEMAIASHHSTFGVLSLGGIFGRDGGAGGSYNNGYFSGTIYHNCFEPTQTDCKIGEFSGNGGVKPRGTETYANQLRSLSSTFGGVTASSFRSDNALRSMSTGDFPSAGAGWTLQSGRYPIFDWEPLFIPTHCLINANRASPSTQIAAGRGAEENPVTICNADQFANIPSGTDKHYILHDNINMAEKMDAPLAGQIDVFAGHLNGNNYIIHGMQGSITAENLGYININNGTIFDLNVVGTNITRDTGTYSSGSGFVSTNNGILRDINFFGLSMKSSGGNQVNKLGGIVSENNGVIENIKLDSVNIRLSDGGDDIGGIVGVNNSAGVIKRISANASIEIDGSSNYTNIGGLIGSSTAVETLDQLEWGGYFEIRSEAAGTIDNCGGIAGSLNGTSLTNSFTNEHSMMNLGRCNTIGGLAGTIANNSVISKSYNAAEVSFGYCDETGNIGKQICIGNGFNWTANGTNKGPIVGQAITGASVDSDTFFASNAHMKEDIQSISGATISGTNCDVTISMSTPTSIDSNSRAFIDEHNNYFSVLTQAGNTFSIDMDTTSALYDASDCTGLSGSLTFTNTLGSNTLGTHKKSAELENIITFCPSASAAAGDSDYICQNTEWDIVEDGEVGDIGFNRVLDYYIGDIIGEPVAAPPIWSLETGKRLPRLLFNN